MVDNPWGRDVFTQGSIKAALEEAEGSDSPFTAAALDQRPSTSAYSAEGGASALTQ